MIFVGDIAVSEAKYAALLDERLQEHAGIFGGKDLICNFEGLVMDDFSTNQNQPILFNHSSVLPVLKKWSCKVAALANNHTLDRPECFKNSFEQITTFGMEAPGAGTSREQAYAPVTFNSQGKEIILFNQCWSVMLQHQQNPSGGVHVAIIDPSILLKQVKEARVKSPDAAIVVFFHWNFDLETLPFPADRNIGRELIDLGANAVVGCHAHCINGAERYKEGYIVYGLGNFFVPWYTFINGHISFPDFAKSEMAFEWDPVTNAARVHFFKYEPAEGGHKLMHLESADFDDSTMLKKYSEYQGMDEKAYYSLFKAKRRKRHLVPVYHSYERNTTNKLKDMFIISRIRTLRLLAKIKLRGWNN